MKSFLGILPFDVSTKIESVLNERYNGWMEDVAESESDDSTMIFDVFHNIAPVITGTVHGMPVTLHEYDLHEYPDRNLIIVGYTDENAYADEIRITYDSNATVRDVLLLFYDTLNDKDIQNDLLDRIEKKHSAQLGDAPNGR